MGLGEACGISFHEYGHLHIYIERACPGHLAQACPCDFCDLKKKKNPKTVHSSTSHKGPKVERAQKYNTW